MDRICRSSETSVTVKCVFLQLCFFLESLAVVGLLWHTHMAATVFLCGVPPTLVPVRAHAALIFVQTRLMQTDQALLYTFAAHVDHNVVWAKLGFPRIVDMKYSACQLAISGVVEIDIKLCQRKCHHREL